jgi:transposase-like protein
MYENCPFCGSADIEVTNLYENEDNEDESFNEYVCIDCGMYWDDNDSYWRNYDL